MRCNNLLQTLPGDEIIHSPEKDLFAGFSALLTELTVGESELMIHDLSLRRLYRRLSQEKGLIRNFPRLSQATSTKQLPRLCPQRIKIIRPALHHFCTLW